MLLVYTDDAGNSYEKTNGFFKDGPYIIHVGVLVNEQKYFHLERLFHDLFCDILGVKDWKKNELHANDIWLRSGKFRGISDLVARRYFAEFVQLLTKLNIKIVAGVQQKNLSLRTSSSKNEEIRKSQYSFLHSLEYQLSKQNETCVIISDGGEQIKSLSELLYKRTQWRYNPDADKRKIKQTGGFKYETRSCFILDQMHFVSSQDSFFIQIVDHVAYVLQRVLTYCYLKKYPQKNIVANINKVPVTHNDFSFFSQNIYFSNFDYVKKDVSFIDVKDWILTSKSPFEYLPDGIISGFTMVDRPK